MSALRYCGELRIRVTYRDASNDYRCVITRPGDPTTDARVAIDVRAPAFLSHAVDSSEAFDDAAHAALSFANDEGFPVESHAQISECNGSTWVIRRTR